MSHDDFVIASEDRNRYFICVCTHYFYQVLSPVSVQHTAQGRPLRWSYKLVIILEHHATSLEFNVSPVKRYSFRRSAHKIELNEEPEVQRVQVGTVQVIYTIWRKRKPGEPRSARFRRSAQDEGKGNLASTGRHGSEDSYKIKLIEKKKRSGRRAPSGLGTSKTSRKPDKIVRHKQSIKTKHGGARGRHGIHHKQSSQI